MRHHTAEFVGIERAVRFGAGLAFVGPGNQMAALQLLQLLSTLRACVGREQLDLTDEVVSIDAALACTSDSSRCSQGPLLSHAGECRECPHVHNWNANS